MAKELQWACGGDKRLKCVRHISSGAVGEVFEVSLVLKGLEPNLHLDCLQGASQSFGISGMGNRRGKSVCSENDASQHLDRKRPRKRD
jgi:hypothetical protein